MAIEYPADGLGPEYAARRLRGPSSLSWVTGVVQPRTEAIMTNLAKALVGLAAAAFVLAVAADFTMVHIGTTAEGWSRASVNLALLAIALVLSFRTEPSSG